MGEPFAVGGLRLESDVSPADWIVRAVRPFEYDVGSLLPPDFPAYARVFHPAGRRVGGREVEVRWAEVAGANGRPAHPGMEWVAITGSWQFVDGADGQPGVWDTGPCAGSLPVRQAARLAGLLAAQTTAADRCWFAVWEGFGGLAPLRDGASAARVAMPNRPMLLLSGPLAAATTSLEGHPFDQRASLWWPDDRAWCVATDVDLMTTYVAGSHECVQSVVADPELEAMPVTADQRTTWDSDQLNPTPPRLVT